MKKILLILFVSLLTFNCSSDENEEQEQEQNSELFAFKGNETNQTSQIIKIDATNGNETSIVNFSNNEYVSWLVYNNATNEILGVDENNQLYKINTTNNSFTTINLDTSDFTEYELVINNINELFAIKSTDDTNGITKLVKINQTNGNETEIINFQQNQFIQSLTFNNSTNEIYGVGSSSVNLNSLYKINTLNNTFSTVDLDIDDNIGYELFFGNSKLYAMKETENTSVTSELIEINPENGNQTSIINFNEYVGELAFDFSENMIFGIGSNNELFRINLSNNSFTKVNLDNSQNIDYELIIKQ